MKTLNANLAVADPAPRRKAVSFDMTRNTERFYLRDTSPKVQVRNSTGLGGGGRNLLRTLVGRYPELANVAAALQEIYNEHDAADLLCQMATSRAGVGAADRTT